MDARRRAGRHSALSAALPRTCWAATAVAASLIAAAPAQGAWTPAVSVSPVGASVSVSRAELAPNGYGRIAWTSGSVGRAADGTLGAVIDDCVADPRFLGRQPEFGLTSTGESIMVDADAETSTCTIGADDSVGPSVPVSPQNGREARDPAVAVDPAGRVLFTWAITGWRIQARSMTSSGHLRAIQTLSPLGEIAQDPKVAIDRTGNGYVVWFSRPRNDCCPYTVYGRAIDAAGNVGPIETLGDGFYPRIAMDRDGDSVIVWRADGDLKAVRRAAGGTLGPIQTLTPDPIGVSSTSERIAMTPGGVATVVWATDSFAVQLRRLSVAGIAHDVQTISASGAQMPDVGVDQAGNAHVIWAQKVGPLDQVHVVQRSPNGTLGPVQTLSDRRSFYPDISVTPSGSALATWVRDFSATGERVQFSAGP